MKFDPFVYGIFNVDFQFHAFIYYLKVSFHHSLELALKDYFHSTTATIRATI